MVTIACPSVDASEESREVINCPSSTFFSRIVPEIGALMIVSSYSICRSSSCTVLRLTAKRAVSISRSFRVICFRFACASFNDSSACTIRCCWSSISISRAASASTRSFASARLNSAFLMSAFPNSSSASVAGFSTNLRFWSDDRCRASADFSCACEDSKAACEMSSFS